MTDIDIKKISADNFRVLKPLFSEQAKINKGSKRTRLIKDITTIVMHWSGGNKISHAINQLFTDNNGYHFLIDEDGSVVQTDKINQRSPHAGSSYGPGGAEVNGYSIGISLIALNSVADRTIQIEAATNLIIDLLNDEELGKNIKWITGHHEISPSRKIDPWDYPFNKTIEGVKNGTTKKIELKYWRAGMPPFPSKLKGKCKCEQTEKIGDITWCKTSSGDCNDHNGWRYNPELVVNTQAKADSASSQNAKVADT